MSYELTIDAQRQAVQQVLGIWRKASGTPVSAKNTGTLQALDYCIIPKSVLSKNSRIDIMTLWQLVGAGSFTLNIQMNEAGWSPPGGGAGATLLYSNTASQGSPIIPSKVQFQNSLFAQFSGGLQSATGSGNIGTGSTVFSTYDFQNNDVELIFAAINPTADPTIYATLRGWSVEVTN